MLQEVLSVQEEMRKVIQFYEEEHLTKSTKHDNILVLAGKGGKLFLKR